MGRVDSNLVYALLKDKEGNEQRIDLRALHSGLYEGFLPTEELSLYELTVVEESVSNKEVDRLTMPLAVNWCREYDAFAPDGRDLLQTLCSLTGGSLLSDPTAGAKLSLAPLKIPKSPALLFLILCGVLFLVDVAVRRLRLKDLKEHFNEWKALFATRKQTK